MKRTFSKIFLSTFFILVFLVTHQIKADTITVNNKTPDKVFVAVYYVKNKQGERWGDSYAIEKLKNITINRPGIKFFSNRDLIFSTNKDDLEKKMNPEKYKASTKVNIGYLKGKNFYIYQKGNLLKACNETTWLVVRPLIAPIETIIQKARDIFVRHEHSGEEATVRTGTNLGPQEKAYLTKRQQITKENLEKMLGKKLESSDIPTIAFCCSGGSYRAMLATLGSLIGAEFIGLLNSSTYIAGVSGSTWMMAPWITQAVDLKTFKKGIYAKTKKPLIKAPIANLEKSIAQTLLPKFVYGQKITLIDIYGLVLANTLLSNFGNQRQRMRLSHSAQKINDGKWIFPIYTAIEEATPYNWFEFTPYEVGSNNLNAYVPTWAFGRKFKRGKSVDFAPEQSLGYLMGIFGSAISISIEEVLAKLKNKIKPSFLFEAINKVITEVGIKKERIATAEVFNFLREMEQYPNYKNVINLKFLDAGIDFNFPFPPLLKPQRKVDIIIVCGASGSNIIGSALKKAEKYSKRNNLKFPKIDLSVVENKTIAIFKDDDPETPTIIYLPLVKNENFSKEFDPRSSKFCKRFNFVYAKEQVDLLTGLTEFNMIENAKIIKDVILETIDKKRLKLNLTSQV